MKTLATLFILFTGFTYVKAQCTENQKTEILLVGDSWAFFMNVDGTINTVAKNWGHSDIKYYTNLTLSENGAETDDFLKPTKVNELANQLNSLTDLKAVHLSIGGNDFLGSWNVNDSPIVRDSLANAVLARLDSIVDTIMYFRPDVHIFWSGYVYTNFGEVIGSLPSIAQSAHPFYSRWQAMGFPTFVQINTMQNWFQDLVKQHFQNNPKFTYIPCSGLMQYEFGQTTNLQVPPGGSYAPHTVSLPYGDVNYPSPMNTMRDYGVTKDCFHLSAAGFRAFISYHFQKFYHHYLMDDVYTLADSTKSGSVSNSGTISGDLKVGNDGTNIYEGFLHFDNSNIKPNTKISKANLYVKINQITGDNFLTNNSFQLGIVDGNYGTTSNLEVADFGANSDLEQLPCVFGNPTDGNWVRFDLPDTMLHYIAQNDVQFRLMYTGTNSSVIDFVNTNDNDFKPVLNMTYGDTIITTATTSLDNEPIVSLYPNPAEESISISSPIQPVFVSVSDVTGKLIKVLDPHQTNFDVSDLSEGIYLLHVDFQDKAKVLKFIKD